ncbi:MAG: sulfatase [Candidatus Aminicenantes bacterium]
MFKRISSLSSSAKRRPAFAKSAQTFLLVCFFIFLTLFSVQCKKASLSQFKTFRLIDHLEEENIIQSPFKKIKTKDSRLYPLESFPMNDLGIGENPYQLKRKLRYGSGTFNILLAPPETLYKFKTQIPDKSVLEFSIGMVRDKNSVKKTSPSDSEEEGTVFLVTLEMEGREKILFQKHLDLPPETDKPTLTQSVHIIDLPQTDKKAAVSLKTKGGKPHFAYWGNPVIYRANNEDKNVILISIDTLRADHLGCYGYEKNTSPNIDFLASEGALFLHPFSSSPWTLPSHVSIMTSLYCIHHQIYYSREKMDPSLLTLADLLRENNFFSTAFTGGGFVSARYGFAKGFDAYYEGRGGVFHMDSAQLIYESFSDWIDHNRGKRFFLFLHTYQPHNPYVCPSPYNTQFLDKDAKWEHVNLLGYLGGKQGIYKNLPEKERKNAKGLYDGEIHYLDQNLIGPLIEKLKQTALYDKTMIIFTSDHGEEFFDHGAWDHGHSLYNESIRVPLIIKFPESKFKGKKIRNFIPQVDIMPTILDEMQIDYPKLMMDGKSLFPILKDREKKDRIFLSDIGSNVLHSHIPQKISMNNGPYKLILNKEFSQKDLDYFTSPPPNTDPLELFDLLSDPKEKSNIAQKNPNITAAILQKINEIYSQAKKRNTEKTEIDEKLKEQLKALGYIH